MRIGLVGRNGAGKTTLTKLLAADDTGAGAVQHTGEIHRSGEIGYLPQDSRAGDLNVRARDRILSARGLDVLTARMASAETAMAQRSGKQQEAAMARYARAEAQFIARGGWAAEAEAARLADNLGLPGRVLASPLSTLSGGQRRRVELARILFSEADILLLDEPTNHLDQDSIHWLRDYLATFPGGFIVISHDVALLRDTINTVFYLDANRAELDVYNLGWDDYLKQREVDERRRRRERANAEKKASALLAQADKMRAKATKAVAAQNMARRAERMLSGLEDVRTADKVAKLRFPDPAPCGRTPLRAQGLSKSYGSQEVFTDVDLEIGRASCRGRVWVSEGARGVRGRNTIERDGRSD